MSKEYIGLISGLIVLLTLIPYALRLLQGKIQPSLTSWFLWTIIAFSLLATYWGAGARESVWMAVAACINPFVITIIIWVKYRGKIKLGKLEKRCLTVGIISLALWCIFRKEPSLVQYALYMAILADACAAIPTAVCYWRDPSSDRPFAWVVFCLASALNIFAISEHTIANYAYPVYMVVGCSFITIPLVTSRIQNKIPLKDWI